MGKSNIKTTKTKLNRNTLNNNDWLINSNILIIKCISGTLCIKTDIDTIFLESNEIMFLHNNVPYLCFTNLDLCEFETTEIPYIYDDDETNKQPFIVPSMLNKKIPYLFKLGPSSTATREIIHLTKESLSAIDNNDDLDYLLGVSSLYKSLYHTINYFNGKTFTCYEALDTDENLNIMLSYINRNFASKITLKDIREQCGLSERQCLRIFSDKLGISPNQLIIIKKMLKSEELLHSHHNYSIKQIGIMSGFNSPSYFNKTFKNVFGTTPKIYREGDNKIKQPTDPMAALLNFFD